MCPPGGGIVSLSYLRPFVCKQTVLLFTSVRPSGGLLMNISRSFHPSPINWAALPELPARLARHNVTLEKARVTLHSFPDSIEIDSLEEAREKVHRGFNLHTYQLFLTCKQDD